MEYTTSVLLPGFLIDDLFSINQKVHCSLLRAPALRVVVIIPDFRDFNITILLFVCDDENRTGRTGGFVNGFYKTRHIASFQHRINVFLSLIIIFGEIPIGFCPAFILFQELDHAVIGYVFIVPLQRKCNIGDIHICPVIGFPDLIDCDVHQTAEGIGDREAFFRGAGDHGLCISADLVLFHGIGDRLIIFVRFRNSSEGTLPAI